MNSALPHDSAAEGAKKIASELQSLRAEIGKSNQILDFIADTVGGSGIRISPLSLTHMNRAPDLNAFADFKYDAFALSLQGMAELLETTTDLISELHGAFQIIGGVDQVEGILEKLPKDVLDRARARLNFQRF